MKIAKKVLAVVIALAMVACCAAMAFAAEDKVVLKATEIVDGKFDVVAYANDYADLKAADWVVTYDAAAVKCVKADNNGTGNFANIATDPVLMAAASGQLMTAYNNDVAGEVKIGFAFQDKLNNAGELALFTLNFEVVDADAKNVEIALTGTDTAKVVINEEVVEEPTEPEEEPSKPESEKPEKPEKPEGGNKPTDSSVAGLAIAAGVVALAGAALVVSKKRK